MSSRDGSNHPTANNRRARRLEGRVWLLGGAGGSLCGLEGGRPGGARRKEAASLGPRAPFTSQSSFATVCAARLEGEAAVASCQAELAAQFATCAQLGWGHPLRAAPGVAGRTSKPHAVTACHPGAAPGLPLPLRPVCFLRRPNTAPRTRLGRQPSVALQGTAGLDPLPRCHRAAVRMRAGPLSPPGPDWGGVRRRPGG